MFTTLAKALVIATIAIVSAGAPASVFAKGAVIIAKPGTKVESLCVREKVQVCYWIGKQHVCDWIDGPNCAVV